MKKYILFFCCLCLVQSCGNPLTTSSSEEKQTSWENYFAQAFHKMSKRQEPQKTVTINGQTETGRISLDSSGWSEELSFFTKNNIDKPSWEGSFTIDTTIVADTIIIEYNRTIEKIPVKKAIIKKIDKDVIYYERLLERSNPISGLKRRLVFEYPNRVMIDNVEELLFLSDHHLKIVYQWD